MRFIGVDIGNSGLRASDLKIDEQAVVPQVRLRWGFNSEKPDRFLPENGQWLPRLQELLDDAESYWLISSVRQDATDILTQALLDSGRSFQIITADNVPIEVQVEKPDRVGIDRLLAAYAAELHASDASAIVIQAGSAVTVDLIDCSTATDAAPCSFQGGAIVPGVPMMLRLLGKGADQLPELDADDLTDLPALPGKNTEEAMLCGASSALVGGVQHLIDRYRKDPTNELREALPVILSGGDGARLRPFVEPPVVEVQDLVLQGLLRLASAMAQ